MFECDILIECVWEIGEILIVYIKMVLLLNICIMVGVKDVIILL